MKRDLYEVVSYEEFKELTVNVFNEIIPEIEVVKTKKNNVESDSIRVKAVNRKVHCTPVIHIDEAYREFLLDPEDINKFIGVLAMNFKDRYENIPEGIDSIDSILDWNYIKENIFCVLINTELNKDILEERPHRKFMNLSVTYKINVSIGGERNNAEVAIDNKFMEIIGKTEEELYQMAYVNTLDILETEKYPYVEVGKVIQGNSSATMLMYEYFLKAMADEIGDNLLIIPSSMDDLIFMPLSCVDEDMLFNVNEIIKIGNSEMVSPDRILSNNAYIYDKNNEKLRIIE